MAKLRIKKGKKGENFIDSIIFQHKGYIGTIEYDETDEIYWGEILNVQDIVTYHGKNIDELYEHFKNAIENYMKFLEKIKNKDI